jgi:lysophospholipase L1-like esterase
VTKAPETEAGNLDDGRPLSRRRKIVFALITTSLSIIFGLAVCEIVFRVLEHNENAHIRYEGKGGLWVGDGHWGWKHSLGYFHSVTSEYDITGDINSLYMNDVAFSPDEDRTATRILALGDSHTYAVGVSTNQTWPKVLESKLNAQYGPHSFRSYNGGSTGFNMHQYLLRLIDQGPVVKPNYVIVGLSYATDLYDLLPPDHGGWIYGGDLARDYFDFDVNGRLTKRHWEAKAGSVVAGESGTTAANVRQILEYSAIFRYLRRSKLALFIGSHETVGGQSLWPNMYIVLEKNVAPYHEYQWHLFEDLISKMKSESDRQGAKLIIVGIPYLPQVYDDLWSSTFGKDPKYSRTAAIERVSAYCKQSGITYVDTLNGFQIKSKEVGRWLHYPKDAHPTAEGQEVIADQILKAGVIASNKP